MGKTVNVMADWIVNDCCEDICQICDFYNAKHLTSGRGESDYDDDIEPCPYRRANGTLACRNGIIEHFKKNVKKGDN
jgi:hypothetical protein